MKRCRPTAGESDGPKTKSKHKIGYNSAWRAKFPWHILMYAEKDNPRSAVTGLVCGLCRRHNTKPQNGSGTWTDIPCTSLRMDVLQRHKQSKIHCEAEERENVKQLVLVVSYVMEEGIKTSFVHIRDLDNDTAESIEAALVQFLSDKAIQITKLRGFGSNGAAVMTGRLTGVATRLKRHSPRMIAVHC